MSQLPGTPEPLTPEPDFLDDKSIDPHPQYARLRAACPVAHLVNQLGPQYVVTRYDDAKAMLTDPRLSKDLYANREALEKAGSTFLARTFADDNALQRSVVNSDPPEHTRLRKLVAAKFTARRTQELRPRIQQIAEELIDAVAGKGEADFVHDFAEQLPVLVIAELLGVSLEDRDQLRSLTKRLSRGPAEPNWKQVADEYTAYLDDQIARKRARPGDDLVSALITSREEDRLTDLELRTMVFVLLIAGHETTANLLANGLFALLQHPDQLALLRTRPELAPNAVEEFLRYEAPVERSTPRIALEDVEIDGVVIPKGSVVMAGLMSANRDERVYQDVDRLDVSRPLPGEVETHLSFGHGIHHCLGAPLARLEAQIGFETVLRRLPGLELAVPAEQITRRQTVLMRALTSLPIRFTPQEVAA
jgi:cytochrome P450